METIKEEIEDVDDRQDVAPKRKHNKYVKMDESTISDDNSEWNSLFKGVEELDAKQVAANKKSVKDKQVKFHIPTVVPAPTLTPTNRNPKPLKTAKKTD